MVSIRQRYTNRSAMLTLYETTLVWRMYVGQKGICAGECMKSDPELRAKTQALTIAELSARCDGPNQFENFDRAFRKSLTVSKEALLKEEARLKRARKKVQK